MIDEVTSGSVDAHGRAGHDDVGARRGAPAVDAHADALVADVHGHEDGASRGGVASRVGQRATVYLERPFGRYREPAAHGCVVMSEERRRVVTVRGQQMAPGAVVRVLVDGEREPRDVAAVRVR